MNTEDRHTCPSCGNEYSGAMEFCPVCMLRMGLAGGIGSGESSVSKEAVECISERASQRFEHYELLKGADGKPVELGRGAMGVTYKAFDVDLRIPVTLKLISKKYVGDELARYRFLREARAAAKVRHSNVASVFHLGRSSQGYFYAMEFVEGETLEKLIKRSGQLEVKPALEIATQTAAGLAAVHKQKLVHRDIKPSNIMVNVEEGTASIHRGISRQEKSPAIRAPKRSIAVLPFETLSPGKENTYFADGVHDEILSNLAKVSQLKVISRTSVMTFRPGDNRNLPSIAESLGVANVVEGTVRRDGNRVRITIRLVDARKDEALWSESYDRDLTDIFAIQSEVAQAVASKLSARLSPEEKKRIEAEPTNNLEAYDLYLRANELVLNTRAADIIGNVAKSLYEAISLLNEAVRIDPHFTLAYCASATANAEIYTFADRTPERRTFADAALNSALRLQPDLPEVHLAYAYYLYGVYRDYERARVQLALARCGLPNDSTAIALAAYMDRRQGNFEKAIQEFNEAISRDPHNAEPIAELGNTLFWTRQFSAAEQAYDRLIQLLPNQPMLQVQKAAIVRAKSGDATSLRLALEGLPTTMANDIGALCWRLRFALDDRDWKRAKELIEKMKGDEDDGNFLNGNMPVPVGCYSILLARLQREQVGAKTSFAQTREELNQKVQKSPGDANLLSQLAVVDALLNNKEAAIDAAKRAVEILPVSRDAKDGPGLLANLAVVYAWSSELDNAFKTINPLTKMPNGISYGDLKLSVWWDPLREDPRFGRLLTS